MMFRVPLPGWLAATLFAAACVPSVRADDAVQAELKSLRLLIELQSKQIEVLTAQVARLNASLEPRAEPGAPGTETTEFAVPVARPVAPASPANTHIVLKGESLEKIAKAHGTTVIDIQKLNHITDPKKLQIGQQIILPPATAKKEGQ